MRFVPQASSALEAEPYAVQGRGTATLTDLEADLRDCLVPALGEAGLTENGWARWFLAAGFVGREATVGLETVVDLLRDRRDRIRGCEIEGTIQRKTRIHPLNSVRALNVGHDAGLPSRGLWASEPDTQHREIELAREYRADR